ncbi:MAG: M1 family metallopeptidase [Myxococcota bacterium]
MPRLPANPSPHRYRLDLEIDPSRERFAGEEQIEIELRSATRTIELHAVDLQVSEVQATDSKGTQSAARVRTLARRESLELRFARPIQAGVATLALRWTGPLRSDLRGLYLARSGRHRYATTQLEAADARRMFPCFDEPSHKARFAIAVTTPARNRVVSNAPVARVTRRGRQQRIEFAETPPLSTYLVALIVGELESSRVRRCGGTPVRVWCAPGKRHLAGFALECAVESLARLERYFGLPYPYAKLDLIAVPDFEFGAMENAGAVTFRETLLLSDPKTLTFAERKRVAEVMAHELAHMWFGDLVTMEWWDDLWLNEAFATWMAFTIVDQWQPDWHMWLDFEHGRSAALGEDALQSTHPIYIEVDHPDQATENFDLITYEKGAAVVRMLERWLGPAVFQRGVRRYIRRHREGNARGADLWSALEEVSGQPVQRVAERWIGRPGYPALEVGLRRSRGRDRLVTRQSRFFSSPRAPEVARRATWPIPAVIRVQPQRGAGRMRLERHLLRRARESIDMGPAGSIAWIYANAEESGFYRPFHEPALGTRISRDLERLRPVERMGRIGHEWAGLRAGVRELAPFLEAVDALAEEPEAEVLDSLIGPLGTLLGPIAHARGDDTPGLLRRWLADRFAPPFQALGWRPRQREPLAVRLRRAALLRLAGGLAEAPQLVAAACVRAQVYLDGRHSLDANLAGSVVAIAAREGGARLWSRYRSAMRRAATPQERTRFEQGLASFRAEPQVKRSLELLLTDDIPTQDVVPLLVRLLANRQARDATWAFIQERWPELEPRISPGLAGRLVGALSALETPQARREVAAFFRAHPIPTAKRALRQTLERFQSQRELCRRVAPQLRRALLERTD